MKKLILLLIVCTLLAGCVVIAGYRYEPYPYHGPYYGPYYPHPYYDYGWYYRHRPYPHWR